MGSIIILTFILSVLFKIKGYNIIKNRIYEIIKNTNDANIIKNNPPKIKRKKKKKKKSKKLNDNKDINLNFELNKTNIHMIKIKRTKYPKRINLYLYMFPMKHLIIFAKKNRHSDRNVCGIS